MTFWRSSDNSVFFFGFFLISLIIIGFLMLTICLSSKNKQNVAGDIYFLAMYTRCIAIGLFLSIKSMYKQQTKFDVLNNFNRIIPVWIKWRSHCDDIVTINHFSTEIAVRETLEQVMADALSKCGSKGSSVRAVCLAVSGVNHPTDQQRILSWLRLLYIRASHFLLFWIPKVY